MKIQLKSAKKRPERCEHNEPVAKRDARPAQIQMTNNYLQQRAEAIVSERASELGQVFIRDYPYHPKMRESFAHSKIKAIIENSVKGSEQIDEIINTIYSHKDAFAGIPLHEEAPGEPYWENGWLPVVDGIMLYSTLAQKNPRWFVEVGSGNTTKFAAKAIRDNKLRTEIISIDPCPRAEIDALCHKQYRRPLEEMDMDFFSLLTEEDVFLMDNSHRAFANSDVTVFFTEILPGLPKGLLYAMHDIALPDEIFVERFYNEQYMLATYLLGGADGDKIYFPTAYLVNHTQKIKNLQHALMLEDLLFIGAFFWMRKS